VNVVNIHTFQFGGSTNFFFFTFASKTESSSDLVDKGVLASDHWPVTATLMIPAANLSTNPNNVAIGSGKETNSVSSSS